MIPNPFLERGPVNTPRLFFGRAKQLAQLQQLFSLQMPGSSNLVGKRRMGKTSLLKYLMHPQGGIGGLRDCENMIFVWVDLEIFRFNVPSGGLDLVFFRHLLGRIHRAVENKLTGQFGVIPAERMQRLQTIYGQASGLQSVNEILADGLDVYLNELLPVGGPLRMGILVDEADDIIRHGLGRQLRSLTSEYPLGLTLTTQRPLEQIDPEGDLSPLYNLCSNIPLGLLEAEEARRLVVETALVGGLEFSLADLEAILRLGGRHPDFLKVCAWVVQDARQEGSLQPALLLRPQIGEQLESACRSSWNSLDPNEKDLLRSLAGGEIVSWQDPVASRLARYGLIDETGRIFSEIFQDYVMGRSEENNAASGGIKKASAPSRALSAADTLLPVLSGRVEGGEFILGDMRIHLSPREFALLSYLLDHEGSYCPREDLYRSVWGEGPYDEKKGATLNVTIQRLRERLPEKVNIQSKRGAGYRLLFYP